MTKKQQQIKTNIEVYALFNTAKQEYNCDGLINCKRLRTCTAYVFESKNYFWLESYGTMVAFIEKETGICYDMLRTIYGYTATSAQHISKFCKDYNAYQKITTREISGCCWKHDLV